ncbi:MAG: hypothetical protein AB7I27_00115 [Bacteriovoracaceae bacterium]
MKNLMIGLMFLFTLFAFANEIDPTNLAQFNILGVNLTHEKLNDAVKKFKGAKIIKPKIKYEQDYEYDSFCLTGDDGTKITFRSNYAFSGDEVAEYTLEAKGNKSSDCSKNEQLSSKIKIPIGLSLGLTKVEVEKILGKLKPLTQMFLIGALNQNLYPYNFSANEKKKSPNLAYDLDVLIGFNAEGKVDTIHVSFAQEAL